MTKDKREIIIKTKDQIQKIKDSGKFLTEVLCLLQEKTKSGISLLELEEIAENYMKQNKIKWAFKWYHWFPANLCLSVNDCVVHWIPDEYILKNWDLLKIDCGVDYQWWISDSAISIVIGWELANPQWYELIQATKKALDEGVKKIKPYKKLFDYSNTVWNIISEAGFSVIKNLTWHGVGKFVHEAPYIYNFGHNNMKQISFKPGMVIALEPITAISSETTIEKSWNHWNLYTQNGDFWAQREYTVLVTEDWNEIISGIQ